ncbi:carboxypeptidase-like regulatory domain-containing protein [Flavobacterium plurextorum]|uniref:carboxypeptidase-like regulatory domain-containing protein n=1 Tax=Flavobacterium TaxID=237 RepID=UPI00214D44B4|nr:MULTISPECIES: carboxypeptidase-like regulatory domain-containing protein [Flavobacterium]UUW10864.1 carboxypeptidase-like regulatory domain-containing protein [Flavobacterium plurextorum]
MKTNSSLLLILFVQISFGQETVSKEISGQILEPSISVEGVNIINIATQVTSVSNADGKFSIKVKEGDVLVFSAINLESLKYRITNADFSLASVQIKMKTKQTELSEVVVNKYAHINAVNLGIVSKNQKKYTAAERKLAVAGDFKPISLLGLLGGSMPLDPILNKINGRTKNLKKNIEVEKKEVSIVQLGYLFEQAYFVDRLGVSSEYVTGFKYYLVENEEVVSLLRSKEKSKLEFLINELAVKYKEIIASELK